jgi:hypothetical protein
VTVNGLQYSDPDSALAALKRSSDGYQGYGYQIWRGRHGTYRAAGAFGQLVVILPEQQAVIATTAGTGQVQELLDAAWQYLLPAMKDAPLAPSRTAVKHLRDRLMGLTLACPAGRAMSPIAPALAGRRFALTENPLGARALSFTWRDKGCSLSLERADGRITIPLGFGRWIASRANAPGLVPWLALFGKTVRLGEIAIAGAYAWKDDQTLTLRLQYIETPHHHGVTVRMKDDELTFETSDGFGSVSHFSGRAESV